MPARINSNFWSAPKNSNDFKPFTINSADVTAGAGGIVAGAALFGLSKYVEKQLQNSSSSDEVLGNIVTKNSEVVSSIKTESEKPAPADAPKLGNFLPNTNLLNILANQNQILQILCYGLLSSSLPASQLTKDDKNVDTNDKSKAEANQEAIVRRENLYSQPFTIKGRVIKDSNGFWLDPITQKFYNPINGDRIFESDLTSFKTETHTNTNAGSGSVVSADVNFKEVLKSQANINSEISKYISTIGENQKVYNQNLEKLVVNSKEYSQAIKEGLAGVKLDAKVDVKNRVDASLSLDRPVEISLPASYAENQKILSENSTKTLEIYKEKAEYDKTSVAIKDLDGNTIAKASPREIALSRQAVQARTYTDENNFELDNEALDLFDLPMPNFKDLFDTELPSTTLLKDVK
ncbi:hypothetical protein [Campylobacter concisus]|uniref:Uncharacterized protein n=1 Tax=Campylobacter concisus (strain 13826) TaxID=360104 RepID=A7ZFD0_CAMC1|nr:hypothetical protein [Campylobacter concisus]EAT98345.1 hypothetical protein CCC13826_0258 [Campylobacter concisus 13826]